MDERLKIFLGERVENTDQDLTQRRLLSATYMEDIQQGERNQPGRILGRRHTWVKHLQKRAVVRGVICRELIIGVYSLSSRSPPADKHCPSTSNPHKPSHGLIFKNEVNQESLDIWKRFNKPKINRKTDQKKTEEKCTQKTRQRVIKRNREVLRIKLECWNENTDWTFEGHLENKKIEEEKR